MKVCILKFDHLSNLLLRSLYCIDAGRLHCINAYSSNRLASPKRNRYTVFLKFWVLTKTHSQKLGLKLFTLVSWIVMFLGYTNTKINNNLKLLSHNNLSIFGGKITPYFFKIRQNSNPHPLCKVGAIQQWLIETTWFCCLLERGGYRRRGNNSTISDKNYGKNCFLDNFLFVTSSPS